MKTALIGYTGFVGHNILRQMTKKIDLYNESNIENIYGKVYDLVVCAAPGGSRIVANKFPGEDRVSVYALGTHLNLVMKIKKLVLISTVEVYPMKNGIDEHTKIDPSKLDDYGRNRRILEELVLNEFKESLVIRLPILFGEKLKKNFIYDLIHNERVEYINPDNELPIYNLEYLWNDILTSLDHDLQIVNLVSEPMNVGEVAKEVFDIDLPKNKTLPLRKYNIWSRHASLWGSGIYMERKEDVLYDLKNFVEDYK